MKPLIKISARHKLTQKRVNMYYVSINQAAYFNPHFEDFSIVELKQ